VSVQVGWSEYMVMDCSAPFRAALGRRLLCVTVSSRGAEVDVDEQGLSAINLERVLSSWPEGKKRPRVI
jgi:hypothetical protein